jgi:hypothetical protein
VIIDAKLGAPVASVEKSYGKTVRGDLKKIKVLSVAAI